MSFDSFALLLSDVFHALGYPKKEHLEPGDIARAALETFAYYGLTGQHSQYGRSEKSVPLPASTRDTVVSLPDLVTPSYLERLSGASPNESYTWIPTINGSLLEEARLDGEPRVSYYRDENRHLHIRFSYDPAGFTHRLWYYTDPVTVGDRNDPLPLPARFGFMFSARTLINTVPVMMGRSGKLPEEQQLTATALNAISAAVGRAQSQLKEWEPLWRSEINADKNPRGRMRTPLIPRGW